MKQKFTFEIEVEAVRHDYYTDAARTGCRRCVFYVICSCIDHLKERFPADVISVSDYPCRQHVESPDRQYIKFLSQKK